MLVLLARSGRTPRIKVKEMRILKGLDGVSNFVSDGEQDETSKEIETDVSDDFRLPASPLLGGSQQTANSRLTCFI